MGQGIVIVAIALIAANLPMLSDRRFFFWRRGGKKGLGWCLLELLFCYCVVGLMAAGLEVQQFGGAYSQGWAFYAVTLCLFVVFAAPGFVWRFLWPNRANGS